MGVRVRAREACVAALEFEFESSRSSLHESASEFQNLRSSSSLSSSASVKDPVPMLALEIVLEPRFEFVFELSTECSETSPRNALGGIPGFRPREHPEAPGRHVEND